MSACQAAKSSERSDLAHDFGTSMSCRCPKCCTKDSESFGGSSDSGLDRIGRSLENGSRNSADRNGLVASRYVDMYLV